MFNTLTAGHRTRQLARQSPPRIMTHRGGCAPPPAPAAVREVLGTLCILGMVALTGPACAQPNNADRSSAPASDAVRNGQHDFDFNIGTWKTHIRRLLHPLSGSHTWTEMNGTVAVRKIWDGKAELEEIEADGAGGHFEGLTLFLYNPQSHQWSQTFSSSASGTMETPVIGEFRNGRGEFFGPDTFDGRAIEVRVVWSDITPNTHRFEQSFSQDGGKTWEPNFVANLTRETP